MAEKSAIKNGKSAVAVAASGGIPFYEYILFASGGELRARKIETMQVNLGLKCNQKCVHCHGGASPTRTECMDPEVLDHVVAAAERTRCSLVDITGGAPELHPKFRWLVSTLRKKHIHVQVRTNLTVLLEKDLDDIPELMRELGVRLVASLPCYLEESVQAQRGPGTFKKSIKAIQLLNSLGYGIKPELPLDLVYNPGGAHLPPEQTTLEEEYHRELENRYDISFTRLKTMTNMPIGRFFEGLRANEQADEYMTLLRESFNPATVDHVMCCNQISINWDGTIFDCDFNLALDMPVVGRNRIENLDQASVVGRAIRTGNHCFGCTAGAGSSRSGALV